jgi:hypothetical protein
MILDRPPPLSLESNFDPSAVQATARRYTDYDTPTPKIYINIPMKKKISHKKKTFVNKLYIPITSKFLKFTFANQPL